MTFRITFRKLLTSARFLRKIITMSENVDNSNKATEISANLVKNVENYGANFKVLAAPLKSESDKKDYKDICLPNGIRVCLISDPSPIEDESKDEVIDDDDDSTEEESEDEDDDDSDDSDTNSSTSSDDSDESGTEKLAACALSISVGSCNDPTEIPGLAHFLEHMIFMGSEKYPEENDFDAFLTSRGGYSNASTDWEVTTFYYACQEKDFFEAMDRFSQFFISPLMLKESMTKEREAVESEFQTAIPDIDYVKEQILAACAKPDSPLNKFAWGNLKTLRDNVNDEELYRKVHEFRNKHYSGHRMTLAVRARLPMAEIEQNVIKYFGPILSNNIPKDDFKNHQNVFDTAKFRKLYYVKPMNETLRLDLTWALPSLIHKYKSKPDEYVAWILGDEGPGSLLSYLRKKVWVLEIDAGNAKEGFDYNSICALFGMSLILTDEGAKHLNEIVSAVFSYIQMMKKVGPQKQSFDEMKQINDTSFKFIQEMSACDSVEEIAENMHLYPPQDYLAGQTLFYEYDPEAIKMVLDHLIPENLNIMVIDNKLPPGIEFDKIEPWFGAHYFEQDIPDNWLKNWINAPSISDLSLPLPNQFLSEDFEIISDEDNLPEYPTQVLKTDVMELWYRKDQKFKLPKAMFCFYLINAEVVKSSFKMVLLDLYVELLNNHLKEEYYPACIARLTYGAQSYDRGLIVRFHGYNDKLNTLIKLVSKHIVEFEKNLNEDMFLAVKDKLLKFYYNTLLKPSKLSKDIRLSILVENNASVLSKFNTGQSVTFSDLKKFSQDFVQNLYIKSLVQGNVSKDHAVEVATNFVNALESASIPSDNYPMHRVVQLPTGENYCSVESFNENPNSFVINYYQAEAFSIKDAVITELLATILEEPAFNTLRTQEQLGYDVSCIIQDTHGVLGLSFSVHTQADKFSTQHINQRIEAFIKQSKTILKTMSADTFKRTKQDLINVKNLIDLRLAQEVKRNWSEIIDDDYVFDRHIQEIGVIEKLNQKDMVDWWTKYIQVGGEKRRKLGIQVTGFKGETGTVDKNKMPQMTELSLRFAPTPQQTNKRLQYVTNVEEFKKGLFVYPVVSRKCCV